MKSAFCRVRLLKLTSSPTQPIRFDGMSVLPGQCSRNGRVGKPTATFLVVAKLLSSYMVCFHPPGLKQVLLPSRAGSRESIGCYGEPIRDIGLLHLRPCLSMDEDKPTITALTEGYPVMNRHLLVLSLASLFAIASSEIAGGAERINPVPMGNACPGDSQTHGFCSNSVYEGLGDYSDCDPCRCGWTLRATLFQWSADSPPPDGVDLESPLENRPSGLHGERLYSRSGREPNRVRLYVHVQQ